MSDKELVDKIVMFRTELERQNAGMGIMSLFDTICSYYREQHRTIKSQKEEIRRRVVQAEINIGLGENVINMQAKIESLKAITELAVNAFKLITKGNIDFPTWTDTVDVLRDVRIVARETLTEIERLQNE